LGKFSIKTFDGIHLGGFVIVSSIGFTAVTNIHKNGMKKIIESVIKTAWVIATPNIFRWRLFIS
jgi:hypothetical protein